MLDLKALAIGRLVPVKDFPLLLTAWIHVEIPLQIAGDGPESEDLHNLRDALRLQDRVTFLGHRDDVDELLNEADLVIIPSRTEGFGYVALEALQHACVVISTPTGFAAEIIPERYLSPSEPIELAETINWTLQHFATAKSDFESVFEYAKTLTVERMADATREIYDLLLSD